MCGFDSFAHHVGNDICYKAPKTKNTKTPANDKLLNGTSSNSSVQCS